MACVGKKIAKYTATGSLMVNQSAQFPKASPAAAATTTANSATPSSAATSATSSKLGQHHAVQQQLSAAARGLSAHHQHQHLAGPLVGGGPYVGSTGAALSCVQKRHRTTFSSRQLKVLEEAFEQNNYPCAAFREQIATTAHLDLSRVQVWFQNRRAKHKKQMNQAMRCFAAAAAAASSSGSGSGAASHQQQLSQAFSYQPASAPPVSNLFQHNQHQQLPETGTLQLSANPAYGAQQQEPLADHLSHLEQQSVYLRSPNALSQPLNFSDPDAGQLMLASQPGQLRGAHHEPYLHLHLQQHHHHQQDLSLAASASFRDSGAEGNLRRGHLLNTEPVYPAVPDSLAKLNHNPPHQTATNQPFDPSQAGAINHARPQPRQHQAAANQSSPLRDGLEYLY